MASKLRFRHLDSYCVSHFPSAWGCHWDSSWRLEQSSYPHQVRFNPTNHNILYISLYFYMICGTAGPRGPKSFTLRTHRHFHNSAPNIASGMAKLLQLMKFNTSLGGLVSPPKGASRGRDIKHQKGRLVQVGLQKPNWFDVNSIQLKRRMSHKQSVGLFESFTHGHATKDDVRDPHDLLTLWPRNKEMMCVVVKKISPKRE